MILTALRRFGMSDFKEIDQMTYREFRLRLKACELKRLDEEYMISLLAWQTREIDARKKKGKNSYRYVYDTFRKFFDYEGKEREIMGNSDSIDTSTIAGRYIEYMRAKQCQTTT